MKGVYRNTFPCLLYDVSRLVKPQKRWVTAEQNEGAKSLVFNILFPLLVFHVLVKAELSTNFIYEILFLDVAWILVYLIGRA